MSVDALAEERGWLSPYQYAQNSPLLRIDPDGNLDEVIITGAQRDAALTELQASVSGELQLAMDANGNVTATQTVEHCLMEHNNYLMQPLLQQLQLILEQMQILE